MTCAILCFWGALAIGITAILSCFDARTGDLRWRKDFSARVDTSKLFTGTTMSPVMEGNLVIAHVGDDRQGSITGFDAETGEGKWGYRLARTH